MVKFDPMRDVFDHTKRLVSEGLQDVGEHMVGFLFRSGL